MEADNARETYDTSKAYKPVYDIYKDTLQNLYYRYLYHYEDTPPIVDWQGVPHRTSLMATIRAKYQFLGNWCWEVIYGEYPMWKERVEGAAEAASRGWQQITVTPDMLANSKGKDYPAARLGTIKMNPITHTIDIPDGKQVVRVVVHGFSNSEHDAILSEVNGQPCHYVYPAKGYNPVYTTHVIESLHISNEPLSITFTGSQCCVVIRVYIEG